jgi:hypothetical protein
MGICCGKLINRFDRSGDNNELASNLISLHPLICRTRQVPHAPPRLELLPPWPERVRRQRATDVRPRQHAARAQLRVVY